MITMLTSTVIAILIITLLPADKLGPGMSLLLIFLVVALAAVSNTVNVAALALNKERFEKLK